MKILLVEDDRTSRKMISKQLETAGYEVLAAENGLEAMELLNVQPIPIVVTDWMMPGMDGLSLCRSIRSAGFGSYIYIIIITAREEKTSHVEGLKAGADDFIPKPVDVEDLKAHVQKGIRIITLENRYLHLQQQLINSRNKLKIVFDAIQEEIVSVDIHFNIMSINKSCSKMVGKGFTEIVDKRFDEFFDKRLVGAVQQAFGSPKQQNFLWETTDQYGSKKNRQVTVLPILNSAKRIAIAIVVMKDVTEDFRHAQEIKALNDRLVQTAVQLEMKNKKLEDTIKQLETTQAQMVQSEKMASIGQLAAGVAHEINNPTGFVSSNLKTLGDYSSDMIQVIMKYQRLRDDLLNTKPDEPLSAEIISFVGEIASFEKEVDVDFMLSDTTALIGDCREGTERIKKIVMDLKDFAHPGNDQLQLIDVNAGLASTLNVVQNEIKYKAEVERSYGDLPAVYAYPQQLNQVFMNILVNAAQAIEKEGTISIVSRAENGFVEVAISDDGCGIAPENIKKIFDPFFTTKEVGKGTGLGMHIVYNIVQKHSGTVSVQSCVGKGTTFTVRIPIEPDKLENEAYPTTEKLIVEPLQD